MSQIEAIHKNQNALFNQNRQKQENELQIRNNPLSLFPESLDTLLAYKFPPTRWIVEDLIPSEGLTIMSAAPGSFKTWLMLEIVLAVTRGKTLFDNFKTETSGVLIVDEESGPRMLKERFEQLGATKGLNITYFSRAGHKVTQEYIDSLISVCLYNEINLIVFDSLVRLHRGDENTSKDMSELFDLFRKLADQGISVLIAHHNRKGIAGSYNPSGDMRGSSDILAAVDCHIALSRQNNSDYVEVRQTKNRYKKELSPFKLRFMQQGDQSEFQYMGTLKSKGDIRADQKQAVLRQLVDSSLPTKKELLESLLASGLDIKNARLGELLEELILESKVDTKGGIRNAVHYFVINPS